MRCLVVDDEALARERLARLLRELEGAEWCGEAANGLQALEQVDTLAPEVVLLDIRMPGMDGLEAARHLAMLRPAPAVIFTTAYGDHALQAFEAQAVDYLLKPIHPQRLQQALSKARCLSPARLEGLAEAGAGARTHLCASSRGRLSLMPVAEVLYFQADHKYVSARSATEEILIEDSLKALEQEFADRFIRVHRNALVAREAIKGLVKEAGHTRLLIHGVEARLEVSRRLLPTVRRCLKRG